MTTRYFGASLSCTTRTLARCPAVQCADSVAGFLSGLAIVEATVTRGVSVSLGLALAYTSRFAVPYALIVMGAGFPMTICAGGSLGNAAAFIKHPLLRLRQTVGVLYRWVAASRRVAYDLDTMGYAWRDETSEGTDTSSMQNPARLGTECLARRVKVETPSRFAVLFGWALAFQAA